MKLTTKGRFAVTAMIDVTLHQSSGPVALAAIAQRQAISLSYLEQLFAKLRKSAVVDSVRGPGGGYVLARQAGEISVADIILAVDEPVDARGCTGKTQCETGTNGRAGKCMTHDLWESLNQKMIGYLDSVPLAELQRKSKIDLNKKYKFLER